MGFIKQLLIKANFDKKKAEKMLKSNKPNSYMPRQKTKAKRLN